MSQHTACSLDCYDACRVELREGKLKGAVHPYTHGYLCAHLNHYEKHERITVPRFKGEEISIEKALHLLEEA